MNTDADIQVWLETIARTTPGIIVPYVQSSENTTLRYLVTAVRESSGGRSEMTQEGTVTLTADVPKALSRMALSRERNDSCTVNLTLSLAGTEDRNYRFNCSE
jgi:curli production protein